MNLQPVKSSNITHIGYDHAQNVLYVKFNSGGTYAYHGITAQQHADLVGAKSIGSHLHAHIKPSAIKITQA